MEKAQDPANAAIFKQFEEACSDFQVHFDKSLPMLSCLLIFTHNFFSSLFQVPATRAAAEQVLTQFRQIPKVLPACQYILGKGKKIGLTRISRSK